MTDEKSYWLVPTNMTHLEPQEAFKIDFSSSKSKKVRIDNAINETSEPYSSNSSVNNKVKFPSKPPSDKELEYFYEQLNSCEKKSCILRVVPKYCEQFKPQVTDSKFPPLFSSFYSEENETLSYDQIILKSEDTFSNIRITETQVSNVENETKGQYTNNKWFQVRARRISASVAKDVCSTKIEKPSISLVKKICYRQNFRTIATSWGIENEENAIKLYSSVMNDEHQDFCVIESGLIIHKDYPFTAASPDGVVNCLCCGNGCVEVKCPYRYKDLNISDIVADSKSYLKRNNNGAICLMETHSYMYQIQTQLLVTEYSYCDFFVYTNKDFIRIRILPNTLIMDEIREKVQHFFIKAILPELLGKYFTNLEKNECNSSSQETWCYCQLPAEEGDMIGCDNRECNIAWFHLKCLRITKTPKEKWFCPECKKHKAKKGKGQNM